MGLELESSGHTEGAKVVNEWVNAQHYEWENKQMYG